MMAGVQRLHLAFALLAGLSSTSCELEGSPESRDWLPLEEGRTWHYKTELFQRRQTVDSRFTTIGWRKLPEVRRPGFVVEEHRSTEPPKWSGRGEKEVAVWIPEGEWIHRVYLQYDGERLVPQTGFEDRRILPRKLGPGLEWQSKTIALAAGDADVGRYSHRHRSSIEAEPVRVPAGTFEGCLRLDTESELRPASPRQGEIYYRYSEWYARGVGLVRMESWGNRERTDLRARTVLLEYTDS